MPYETYKLGKIQKQKKNNNYTHEELEQLDLPRLREICKANNIKPPTLETLKNREELIELIYRYAGTTKQEGIYRYDNEAALRLKTMIQSGKQVEKQTDIEIPTQLIVQKEFHSFDEENVKYEVISSELKLGRYALLIHENYDIGAIIQVSNTERKHIYRLSLKKEMMSKTLSTGSFTNMSLILFTEDTIDEVIHRYQGISIKKKCVSYIKLRIPELLVISASQTKEVLVIDYGTSYTTAGVYHHTSETSGRIGFTTEEGGERCELCPSVVAVKRCSGNEIEFLFAYDAIKEEQKRGYISKNSIFYDTKRWVNDYKEMVKVTDFEGNTCEIQRSLIVGAFLLYIIKTAEQQNKVKYKNIYFTCPVKQKGLSLNMYQDVLKDYNILTKDITDEAVSVVYHSIGKKIEALDYESGRLQKVLLLDCGGGTSDMVQCDYSVTNQSILSRIDMKIRYAHGDTNFGGNNLTYRILQYIKIRFAECFIQVPSIPIEELLTDSLGDVYEFIDNQGMTKAYESISNRYKWAERIIPTKFTLYKNTVESDYLKIKGNYYFLWNLAENLKKELFSTGGPVKKPLSSFFVNRKERKSHLYYENFNLTVKNANGILETHTACPNITIGKDEINLLLKPSIYHLIKNFIEPYYLDGRLDEINQIYLSGQTTKIELFREVLKEFIAGRKAKSGSEYSCVRKFMCLDGAVAYQGAKKTGRIHPVIEYASAIVPYNLTVADYQGREKEKYLIVEGTTIERIYEFISRYIETEEIIFTLRDRNGKELSCFRYHINAQKHKTSTYEYLLQEYSVLRQEDIDNIVEGEIKLFVFSENGSWGFYVLEVSRSERGICYKEPCYIPFEDTEWQMDFFDGFH